jgi:hypothetical protein
MLEFKYVCPVFHYIYSRGTISRDYSEVKFFETQFSLLNWVLKNMYDMQLLEIYNISTGKVIGTAEYEIGFGAHCCTSVFIKLEGMGFKLLDNGFGKLYWRKEKLPIIKN